QHLAKLLVLLLHLAVAFAVTLARAGISRLPAFILRVVGVVGHFSTGERVRRGPVITCGRHAPAQVGLLAGASPWIKVVGAVVVLSHVSQSFVSVSTSLHVLYSVTCPKDTPLLLLSRGLLGVAALVIAGRIENGVMHRVDLLLGGVVDPEA